MKGKLIIVTILTILMLVTTTTVNAGTVKMKEDSNEEHLLLSNFLLEIDDVFNDIREDYSDEEYDELYSQVESALSKATIVNEDGEEIVDLELFENELNSQPVGIRKNMIKYYRWIFISGEKDSFDIIRTPSEWHWNWQYDWVLGSDYKLELYNDWQSTPGNIPVPKDEPVFYAKKVYFKGWVGQHKPINQSGAPDGVAGVIAPVFAIGSKTQPDTYSRPVNLLFMNLLAQFPILAKLLKL